MAQLRPRPLRHLHLLHRFPYLNDDHARIVFEEVLEATRRRQSFYIYGYVLMPNHVHLLLSEPKNAKLSDTFRTLKTQTSHKLKGDRKQFWQTRYFDRNIITWGEFVEKLQYMHRNPVRARLVERPEDWPWSSYRHWQTGERGASKSSRTGHGGSGRKRRNSV